MKVTIEVKIRPFMVPNGVVRDVDDAGEAALVNGIKLSELDSTTLYQMCEEFKTAVFAKAKKQPPTQKACSCQ